MQEENNMSEQWQKTIQHIVDRVDDCIRNKNDESLTLKLLAQEFGYSEFHFSRKFREISGMQFPGVSSLPKAGVLAQAAARHRGKRAADRAGSWLFLP